MAIVELDAARLAEITGDRETSELFAKNWAQTFPAAPESVWRQALGSLYDEDELAALLPHIADKEWKLVGAGRKVQRAKTVSSDYVSRSKGTVSETERKRRADRAARHSHYAKMARLRRETTYRIDDQGRNAGWLIADLTSAESHRPTLADCRQMLDMHREAIDRGWMRPSRHSAIIGQWRWACPDIDDIGPVPHITRLGRDIVVPEPGTLLSTKSDGTEVRMSQTTYDATPRNDDGLLLANGTRFSAQLSVDSRGRFGVQRFHPHWSPIGGWAVTSSVEHWTFDDLRLALLAVEDYAEEHCMLPLDLEIDDHSPEG